MFLQKFDGIILQNCGGCLLSEIVKLSIEECFQNLEDPRIDRTKKHRFLDIITIGLCSILAGGESFEDMEFFGKTKESWLKSFLQLHNGIPSHDTFRRVFQLINPVQFSESFFKWAGAAISDIAGRQIAIDGKALRGSARSRKKLSPLHLVSAWCNENGGLIVGQVKTADKSNEITAIPKLLDTLLIQGAIVTIDAIGCQKEIAEKVVNKGGQYILALKGNQKSTHSKVVECFNDIENNLEQRTAINFDDYFDSSFGRNVRRRTWVIDDPQIIKKLEEWPSIASIIVVEAIRSTHKEAPVTSEFRFYISSIEGLNAKKASSYVRNHWTVENNLHWNLDVAFKEDSSRVREKNSAQNLGFLRRLSVSLLQKDKTKKLSLKRKRMKCAMDEKYLEKVLAGILEIGQLPAKSGN